jgi:hypothetical protein
VRIKSSIRPGDVQRVVRTVQTVTDNVNTDVRKQVAKHTLAVHRSARQRVRTDMARLKTAIQMDFSEDKYTGFVEVHAHYAPYVEFGTGDMVSIPHGLEEYAREFKGRGIRKVNLPARPFLFPALEAQRREYYNDVKAVLR